MGTTQLSLRMDRRPAENLIRWELQMLLSIYVWMKSLSISMTTLAFYPELRVKSSKPYMKTVGLTRTSARYL